MFMEAELSLQVPNDLKSQTLYRARASSGNAWAGQAQWEEIAMLLGINIIYIY